MKDFYGLAENPFALTPDPRFISWSATHRATFQHLIQAHQNHQQMSVVLGDRGMGKTTLLHALKTYLQAHAPQTPLALLPLSSVHAHDLCARIAAALGWAGSGRDRQADWPTLEAFFLHHGQADARIVLLLDATHDVPETLLEEIGVLMSCGTAQKTLFHIVLAGPLSLQDTLRAPRFGAMHARVRGVCHLAPLTQGETHAYITQRLAAAGCPETPLFHPDALGEIYRCSRGIPRAINILCSHALLSGFRWQRTCIDAEVIRHVVNTMGFPEAHAGQSPPYQAQSTGYGQGRAAKQQSLDANGRHELPAKSPPRVAQRHTGPLPGVRLALGVMLLVVAGLCVTSGGLVPERGAWRRALGPPASDKRLPAAREDVPGAVPGAQEPADLAAVAVQHPSVAPLASNKMEPGEPLWADPQRSAGPVRDELPPAPTRAPHRSVAAPLPTVLPSGRGGVDPLEARQPPPEQFIRLYYQAINQRQYTQTWAMLSPHFKKTRLCCDAEGNYKFDTYTGWWNTIAKVEILGAQTPARDTRLVVVLGTVRYYKKNGSVIDETHRFSLVEDPVTKSWLIEEQTRGMSAQKSG